jgi:hypothetical protein
MAAITDATLVSSLGTSLGMSKPEIIAPDIS